MRRYGYGPIVRQVKEPDDGLAVTLQVPAETPVVIEQPSAGCIPAFIRATWGASDDVSDILSVTRLLSTDMFDMRRYALDVDAADIITVTAELCDNCDVRWTQTWTPGIIVDTYQVYDPYAGSGGAGGYTASGEFVGATGGYDSNGAYVGDSFYGEYLDVNQDVPDDGFPPVVNIVDRGRSVIVTHPTLLGSAAAGTPSIATGVLELEPAIWCDDVITELIPTGTVLFYTVAQDTGGYDSGGS